MKHSDIFVLNGIIYNQITDVIAKAKLTAKNQTILVVCHDNEVFDEAMKTIANRFPQNSFGVLREPDSGTLMPARRTIVTIKDDLQDQTIKLEVMTDAIYQADKAAVDAKTYNVKYSLVWTGGQY